MTSRPDTLLIALHAAQPGELALCSAIDMAGDGAPEWVHLLPAGEIRTGDGRGPYRVGSMAELIATSLPAGARLVLDENHATDLAAPKGLPAPAAGWIVALEARADGLWGRVEWTEAGKALVAGRAYRGISPVIIHDRAGNVVALQRASLVNVPNLKGLVALHQEQSMNPLLAKLIAKLGLADGTSEDAVLAAIDTSRSVALQAQLGRVATAVGLGADANEQAVLGAIQSRPSPDAVTALQAELATVTTELNTLKTAGAKARAETFVDGAIKAGRVGVKPLRDHYVSRHMADPASVEKEIGAMPVLNGQTIVPQVERGARDAGGNRVLTAEQERAIQLMGVNRDAFIKQLEVEEQRQAAL